jgi:hypothetical protein
MIIALVFSFGICFAPFLALVVWGAHCLQCKTRFGCQERAGDISSFLLITLL